MTEEVASTMTDGVLTPALVSPIIDNISSNVAVLVPIGISVFGIMIACSLIPKIIYKFL